MKFDDVRIRMTWEELPAKTKDYVLDNVFSNLVDRQGLKERYKSTEFERILASGHIFLDEVAKDIYENEVVPYEGSEIDIDDFVTILDYKADLCTDWCAQEELDEYDEDTIRLIKTVPGLGVWVNVYDD